MENYLKQDFIVTPSFSDPEGKLSVVSTFYLFMDMAAMQADRMGLGYWHFHSRHLFWLTVKTHLHFYRRPLMEEKVTVETWPEEAHNLRCDRDYRIKAGNEVLVEGKTEWAVLNYDTGRLEMCNDLYGKDFTSYGERVLAGPFERIREDFSGCTKAGTYIVQSTDIDVGGHMNNSAYLRAAASLFSTDIWKGHDIEDIQVLFRTPCYEGDQLTMWERDINNGCQFKLALPGKGQTESCGGKEDTTVVLISCTFRK